MNSRSKEQLVKRYKCNPDRITVVIGGYDDTIYFSNDLNKTATRDVILVSRFDPRKNPLLLKQTVEQGTHLTFTLLGVNWHQSGVLDDLLALPNFRYVEDFEATDLVEMYRSHKIYLSVSANEGGPIPLLESLATGLVPVATDTGFAQDVLRGDMMKFIIPQTASASSIVKVLDEAMKFDTQLKTFTNATRQYSWERIRSKFTLE